MLLAVAESKARAAKKEEAKKPKPLSPSNSGYNEFAPAAQRLRAREELETRLLKEFDAEIAKQDREFQRMQSWRRSLLEARRILRETAPKGQRR